MIKKRLYFVQAGFEFDGSVYLPYAVGTIIAYCLQNEIIRDHYAFQDIIYRRNKLADTLEGIVDPSIVFFSSAVWNNEYNKALACLVKEKYPDCLVIFGGHNIDPRGSFLKENAFADILVFGEGEVTVSMLLQNLLKDSVGDTPNIEYRLNGQCVQTERQYFYDLTAFPSPYLSGVFDPILQAVDSAQLLAVLETNRGCPYLCAYCDWTAGHKMRHFPLEKIFKEIDWLAEKQIEYVFCADSNFGMFERDIEIAKKLVESKRKTGYPKTFRPCYEKNSEDRVFQICKLLNEEKMDKGATFSYQTLSDVALANIGRKNLTMQHFSSLMKRYNEAGIPTYSEIILGLPGETYESFCKGLCSLLENGQHNSISVYYCEALPNSRLTAPDYMKKHGIEVIKVAFNHIHSAPKRTEEVKEYSNLIRATATLSSEQWVESSLFSICMQTFHSLGVLRFFALYLYNEGVAGYFEFYNSLLQYLLAGKGRLSGLFRLFKQKFENSLDGEWNYHNDRFGYVTWTFEEGAFLEIASEMENEYDELIGYLKSFQINETVFQELLKYQKFMLNAFEREKEEETFSFDFHTYFHAVIGGEKARLVSKPIRLKAIRKKYDSLPEYAKHVVWFGRRRGETLIKVQEL